MKILNYSKFYHIRGEAGTYFLALNRPLEKNSHKVMPFAMKDERNLSSEFEYFL